MKEERFDDFPIYEIQDDWPLINQCDISAQGRHERCVLETYDTRADHDDLFRQTNQVGKVVCIHNALVVNWDVWAVSGSPCVALARGRASPRPWRLRGSRAKGVLSSSEGLAPDARAFLRCDCPFALVLQQVRGMAFDHLRGGRFSGIRHPGRTDSRRTHVIAPFILKCFEWKPEHLTLAVQ
jgi:hypothetical protein